ncbi:MAG: CpaD family pilus assembly protein [Novosphingobium sp.]|nr:CpaD family pilus assembly protein [Novosphingobium sp.]
MIRQTLMAAPRKAGVACALSLAALVAGCGGIPTNRTVESVHQPVVERTNYTLDLQTGPGGLPYQEQRRLADWFETMDLRYGDRIAVDDPLDSPQTRAMVESITGRYGLLLSDRAPVTTGHVNAGTARIVVTRSTASVPSCPRWSNSDANPNNATSSNYGCAVNSNLAAMVANPEHLLKGAEGTGETTIMSSNKAIDTYREQDPTGKQGLKAANTGN